MYCAGVDEPRHRPRRPEERARARVVRELHGDDRARLLALGRPRLDVEEALSLGREPVRAGDPHRALVGEQEAERAERRPAGPRRRARRRGCGRQARRRRQVPVPTLPGRDARRRRAPRAPASARRERSRRPRFRSARDAGRDRCRSRASVTASSMSLPVSDSRTSSTGSGSSSGDLAPRLRAVLGGRGDDGDEHARNEREQERCASGVTAFERSFLDLPMWDPPGPGAAANYCVRPWAASLENGTMLVHRAARGDAGVARRRRERR